jgi:UDP-GlcNAc:undecaprenyl-phosphate GlcNAc-1-phosphate transferase
LILAAAIGGGLLGFVRFNTFPARVFMGDLGSQFLGFSVAVLAIWLTQHVNPSLSKSSALLLVGLPVVDILAVLYQRIRAKMNWFRATRNHVHHRLLDLGFDHYQAVLVIYAIQAVLNLSAVFFGFESDAFLLALYFSICGGLFVFLYIAERHNFRIKREGSSAAARFFMRPMPSNSLLVSGPLLFVQVSVPSYLVITSIAIGSASPLPPVPIYVVGLIGLLGVLTGIRALQKSVLYRLALYSSIGVIAYCIYSAAPLLPSMHTVANLAYFLTLAVALSLAASQRRGDDFAVTNMDFLIILGLLAAEMFSLSIIGSSVFWTVAIGTVLVFYACELIIVRSGVMWNRILGTATAGALSIIVVRVFL